MPEGSQAILLTEEEYKNTLEGGGNHIPPPEIGKKTDEKGPMTTKATIGDLPSTKNSLRQGKEAEYVSPDVQYCQPMSSKTKVEDLVMNDKEEEPL